MTYDTIIRNGRWFDGTGAPSAVRTMHESLALPTQKVEMASAG